MKLVKPSIMHLWTTPRPLKTIERAGRTCYKSEDMITAQSSEKFVEMLLKRGHEAMIEHASASYRVICDRGVTHEIVRHRLFSYAQESTRYCNYKGGVTFIIPPWLAGSEECREGVYITPRDNPYGHLVNIWFNQLFSAEAVYINLVKDSWTPQQARSVLPNSLKTEIVITGNLREWRHFFSLRCAKAAHPQMRETARLLLCDITKRIPILFDEYNVLFKDMTF